ncbi:MAG: hypothetical protein QNJ97_04215 [Myxococcota bacterium]|nr:hypothetical protein [Myxococcota bacterium]
MSGNSANIEEIIAGLGDVDKQYHDLMIEAGFVPEMVGDTLTYARPAVMLTRDSSKRTAATTDGIHHPLMRLISL